MFSKTSGAGESLKTNRQVDRRWLACALLAHALIVGYVAYVNSPNLDEPAHLSSGIHHWTFGRFDFYRVNPPLVRMIAAAPVLAFQPRCDWAAENFTSVWSRPEFHAGKQFVSLNGSDAFFYVTVARWACVPVGLVGLWTVFTWASELYGRLAGLTAVWLYCICPNMIAWGASITPDAVAASLGVFACYCFSRWLRSPRWSMAVRAGLALGLVELAKGTWIMLFVLWPGLWMAYQFRYMSRNSSSRRIGDEEVARPSAPFVQLVTILVLAVYLMNLGYGFEGSFKRLGDHQFVSSTLTSPLGSNRFSGTWVGELVVPLPENYVRGMDFQKSDFERGKCSYLAGEQKMGGWWYYYLVGFALKLPLGSLVLFGAATLLAVSRREFRSGMLNELQVILPALAILILVSSQTGFSRYLRYAIPTVPFACIHASRTARIVSRRRPLVSAVFFICCVAATVESLAVFPHSMSFFNLGAGGPLNGHAYLLDANIDWGQDLRFLKKWHDDHPDARPLHLMYFGERNVSPQAARIDGISIKSDVSTPFMNAAFSESEAPAAGWYAVSVNHLKGYRHYDSDLPHCVWLQQFEPVARAGYSIYIYNVTVEQARLVRKMPESSSARQLRNSPE